MRSCKLNGLGLEQVKFQARATEEAHGLIHYLRPEHQDPGYQAPVNETMDFGDAAVVLPDNIIPWPKSLPEQATAVQSILTTSGAPLAA